MIITTLVKTGVGKEICDDSVFDGNTIITQDSIMKNECDSNQWIAVADGVGGNAGGHEASVFLLDYIKCNYRNVDKESDLISMLKDANKHLIEFAKDTNGKEDMATTFTGIFFGNENVKVAHSGNTRVYALQSNYLKQLTSDHTTYQWLMMQGNYEAAENCNKSEIISCFGGGDETLVKFLVVDAISHESIPRTLIMTTDGIHDYVDIDTFENIISEQTTMQERIIKLWEIAKENGSCDDCSILVMEW